MVTPLIAARAYAGVQGSTPGLGGAIGGLSGAEPKGPNFSQLVNSAISDAVSSSKQAEHMMTAQIQGKAELLDVVTAISSAEASLDTVIAVRDQVIAAYQEILRMPI